jgi:hypothetical protein
LLPDAKQPQPAVTADGTIAVTFGAGNTLYAVTSKDGGKTFSERVVIDKPGELSLGMRRGPRIVAAGKAFVVTAIAGEHGKGADGDVLAWRSSDSGRTWSKPVTVNHLPGAAREGLHAMAAASDGTVACVWNDARSKKMEVWASISTDVGATWSEDWLIYRAPNGPICPCCHPSATFDAGGTLHVMWRNDLDGNRDMYFRSLRKSAGGAWDGPPAMRLGEQHWLLKACPMDGGGLAAVEGGLETIWRRGEEVFRCRRGERETLLGRGEQPWAGSGADGVYFAWIEKRPGTLKVLRPGDAQPIVLAQNAMDPAVAGPVGCGKGPVVITWEEGRGSVRQLKAAVLNAQ